MERAMRQAAYTAPIQVRTTEENRDWLKKMAREDDRSVNWLINKIFAEARASYSQKCKS
jgi:hypothetical protein